MAAGILVDRDVLVLHLVDEQGRLEHLLRVPGNPALAIDVVTGGIGQRLAALPADRHLPGMGVGLRRIGGLLRPDRLDEIVDLPVVVLVPDVVHGGEAEILVHSAVARDIVIADRAEQDFADKSRVGWVGPQRRGLARLDIEVVVHIAGRRIAAAGRTADAREAGEQIDVAGNGGERILE